MQKHLDAAMHGAKAGEVTYQTAKLNAAQPTPSDIQTALCLGGCELGKLIVADLGLGDQDAAAKMIDQVVVGGAQQPSC